MSKISESWPFSNRHDASMPSMECEALGIMGRHDVGYQVGRRIADYVIVANLQHRRVKGAEGLTEGRTRRKS